MKRWIWLLLLAALAAPLLAEAQVPLRCKVTLTPPVYIDGSVDFLSCDPSGSLRTLTLGGTGGGTFSTFGLVWPTFGTAAGYPDGAGLMQGARVHDLDTGLGVEYNFGVNLRFSGAGGSVEAGTVANPFNVNVVSGGGGGTQYNQGSVATGADTLTMAGAVRHDTAAVDAGVADGDRVVLSTDASGRIWTNGSGVTQPISVASLPLPAGAATAARQDTGNTSLSSIDGKIPASPATTGKQDTGNASVASIDGKVPADPAREGGNLATLAGKDFATAAKQDTAQTTLGQIKTDVDKIPADPAREGGNLATLVTNTTAIATAARQDTGNASLASIKTNTDPLVTAGAGGYVRQDSNATIAKESGGNLAATATSVASIDTKTLVGALSAGNSSASLLTANATFTGTFEDVKNYAALTLTVFADQGSATDGLTFDWSHDGVNQDLSTGSTVYASSGRGFSITPRGRYFRVRYTNGATDQTVFRLGVIYHPSGSGLITRPLDQSLDTENYAETVRAVQAVQDATGSTFTNVMSGAGSAGNGVPRVVLSNDSVVFTRPMPSLLPACNPVRRANCAK